MLHWNTGVLSNDNIPSNIFYCVTIMDEFLEQFLKTLTLITLYVIFPLIVWSFFIALF